MSSACTRWQDWHIGDIFCHTKRDYAEPSACHCLSDGFAFRAARFDWSRGCFLHPIDKRQAQLLSANPRLAEDLRKAHIIIDVQKKVAALLGNPITEPDPE